MAKLPPRNVIPLRPASGVRPLEKWEKDYFGGGSVQTRAWCIATFDAAGGQLIRAAIYSEERPTQHLQNECLLQGPVGMGRTYEEARNDVEKQLKEMPSYRWLWRAVRDYAAKTGLRRG